MLAPTDPLAPVRRAIRRTVLVGCIHNAARALWPGLFALAVAAAAGPVVALAPPWVGSLFALAAWPLVVLAAWRGISTYEPMTGRQAARLMEVRAGLSELGPLSALEDRPGGEADPLLWSLHARRTLAAASGLTRPALPKLRLMEAVAALALVLVLGTALLRPGASFGALVPDLAPLAGDGPMSLEVWSDPPSYTGRPPIRLDRLTRDIELPEGARIRVRMDGPRGAPVLRVPGETVRLRRGPSGAWEATASLQRTGMVKVSRLGTRAVWHVTARPDAPPQIVAMDQPVLDPRGRILLGFTASDDVALAGASLVAVPIDPPEGLRDAAPVGWELELGEAEDGTARQLAVDVARHPLAGLPVELWLEVRDARGQVARSQPFRMPMPSPRIQSDLSAALQEIRLDLLREARPYRFQPPLPVMLLPSAGALPMTGDFSDPLSAAPPGVRLAASKIEGLLALPDLMAFDPVGTLTLRSLLGRLRAARTGAEAHRIDDGLWPLVVRFNSGSQTPAQQRLQAARDALEQALRGGAGDSEIEQLMQEMRAAVGERLRELAEQQQGEGDKGGQSFQPGGSGGGDGGGETLSEEDLAQMLDDLENNGRDGARDQALAQLDALDSLMQGLTAGSPEGAQGGQSSGSALSDLLREQEQLADETEAEARAQEDGATEGQGAGLARRQRDLSEAVGRAEGDRNSDSQREAARSNMDAAAEALERGDLEAARQAQDQALSALRDAARAQDQSRQDAGEDPLGRPGTREGGTGSPADGRSTRVPDRSGQQRARDIREELRRRQGEPDRSDEERGYIDRLLENQ
jgi:hypothetical protein